MEKWERRVKGNECAKDQVDQIMKRVADIYSRSTDWIEFHQSVLGPQGVVRTMLQEPRDLAIFERSPEYQQIQTMLSALRGDSGEPGGREEPTRVLTIRVPLSLHRALKGEAHQHQTSVNKWCITKLLQDLELPDSESPQLPPRRPAGLEKN